MQLMQSNVSLVLNQEHCFTLVKHNVKRLLESSSQPQNKKHA